MLSVKVRPKNYTLFMAVSKDFKSVKLINRPELDDLQNTNH